MKHIYDFTTDDTLMKARRKKAEEFIAAFEEEIYKFAARHDDAGFPVDELEDFVDKESDSSVFDDACLHIAYVKVSFRRNNPSSWQKKLESLVIRDVYGMIALLYNATAHPEYYVAGDLTVEEWDDYYGDYDDCDPEEMDLWDELDAERKAAQARQNALLKADIQAFKRLRELLKSIVEE